MTPKFKDNSGYSMIEVLAAIVILSLAILPMVSMFDAGLRAAVLGGNYDTGRALANEKLDEVRALGYEEAITQYPPVNGTPSGSIASGSRNGFDYEIETRYVQLDVSTGRIEADPDARTRMQVDVTVEWDDSDYETSGLMTASAP